MQSSSSIAIAKYIKSISEVNEGTGHSYALRLEKFSRYFKENYAPITIDEFTIKKTFAFDVYDMLSSYVGWLRKNANLSNLTLKLHMVTVKNFLEFCDIEISPRKFKNRVKLPRAVRKFKGALTKEDIIKIIHGCSNNKLKTYIMLLAATGCRASEALSIRICDCDFTNNKIFIRGEHTKTREDRYVFLTKELMQQLQDWLSYKYRKRRIGFRDKAGKSSSRYFTPERNENDLIFSEGRNDNSQPNLFSLYVTMAKMFNETLDRIGFGSREDISKVKGRRKITLHSFRRHVKSVISDLGYSDYSEWYIGHMGSTYYRKNEKEKYELFHKIEPYLTYLDYSALERKGADIASKVEALEKQNQKLTIESEKITKALNKIDTLKEKLGIKLDM